MSRYFRAEIAENRRIDDNHNLLFLKTPPSMKEPLPGQFFMLQSGNDSSPLLKRPFSLFRRTEGGVQILYRVQGKGTDLLRKMREGSAVEVLGPLGNGYPVLADKKSVLIIAGGIGIASVFSLAEKFCGNKSLFYGAKIEGDLLLTGELRKVCPEMVLCTDDGSCGVRGSVVDVMDDYIRKHLSRLSECVIYACGPAPMLREIALRSAAWEMKTYISMEAHMACGLGACLGCVVKTRGGYKRVCMEGPVFEASEIIW